MFVTPKSFVSSQYAPVEVRNQDYEKGFWESAEDAFDYSRYTDLSVSRQNNLHDEYQEVVDTVKRKTGVQLKIRCGTDMRKRPGILPRQRLLWAAALGICWGFFIPKPRKMSKTKVLRNFMRRSAICSRNIRIWSCRHFRIFKNV